MKDGEEGQDKNQGTGQHTAEDAQHQALEGQRLLAEVFEDRNAESLKGIVSVEQTPKDLKYKSNTLLID